ncbi:Uncharacterised protein [Mycobacteroides abscessus]|nr:Uncharacterised protein [Mycobacteroides abscessus]
MPPARVVTCVKPSKFCTTPPTREIGSRMRRHPRTRSTQKLPIVPTRRYAKPRTSATATAMPTAADTKFCTASPASCTV